MDNPETQTTSGTRHTTKTNKTKTTTEKTKTKTDPDPTEILEMHPGALEGHAVLVSCIIESQVR